MGNGGDVVMAKHPVAEICGGDSKRSRTAESGGPMVVGSPVEKKKMARVPQVLIDGLIESHKRRPPRPVRVMADEKINLIDDDDLRQRIRNVQHKAAATLKKAQDRELDIIAQYRAKGYAEVEVFE